MLGCAAAARGRFDCRALHLGEGARRYAVVPAGRVVVVTGEGRRRAGAVSGPCDRPGHAGPDDRFAKDLPALRAAVWTMPHSAVRLLQRQVRARGPVATGHGVDVMILLGEALLRCRDAAAAMQAAGRAVQAAESLDPVDGRRRLCAYGVAADITLYARQPAVAVYNEYLHQLTTTGDWAGDALRTVYARAGHAVATWREQSRAHGLQLLADLCEWSGNQQGRHHAVTIALVEALTTMHRGCRDCGSRTAQRRTSHDAAPPLPGGILQPDLIQPDRAYLASRVHDCSWEPR